METTKREKFESFVMQNVDKDSTKVPEAIRVGIRDMKRYTGPNEDVKKDTSAVGQPEQTPPNNEQPAGANERPASADESSSPGKRLAGMSKVQPSARTILYFGEKEIADDKANWDHIVNLCVVIATIIIIIASIFWVLSDNFGEDIGYIFRYIAFGFFVAAVIFILCMMGYYYRRRTTNS